MRLWEINLFKNDGTPIAFDKLWAYFVFLKGGQADEKNFSFMLDSSIIYVLPNRL